jgi:hypothetical protein
LAAAATVPERTARTTATVIPVKPRLRRGLNKGTPSIGRRNAADPPVER